MYIKSGIGNESIIKGYHEYESLGGPPLLTLDIDEDTFEFYCGLADLKRLIDTLQSIYDKSPVYRR